LHGHEINNSPYPLKAILKSSQSNIRHYVYKLEEFVGIMHNYIISKKLNDSLGEFLFVD